MNTRIIGWPQAIVSLLVVVAASGCFVVPATSTSTRSAGTATSELRYGAVRGLELSTTVEGPAVTVRVLRKRDCLRDIYRVSEITERKRLRMGGVDDPRGLVFGAILAPVTLPISLLISGVIVASDREASRREKKLDHVETTACTQPGDRVSVAIELASGQRFERVTDATGAFAFQLPETEPYRGTIVARAETQSVELKYRRRMPAVTAVREAVKTCAGEQGLTGWLDVRIAVNGQGSPTKVELDRSDLVADGPLAVCITTQIARVQFSEAHRGMTIVLPFKLGS